MSADEIGTGKEASTEDGASLRRETSKDLREMKVDSPEARARLGGGGRIPREVRGPNAASGGVNVHAGPKVAKVAANVLTRPASITRSNSHSKFRGSRGLGAGVHILCSKAKKGIGGGERIRSLSQSMTGNGEGKGR